VNFPAVVRLSPPPPTHSLFISGIVVELIDAAVWAYDGVRMLRAWILHSSVAVRRDGVTFLLPVAGHA